MNKIILGATFVAIAALVGSPILAEAITELQGAKVLHGDDGNYQGIVFKSLDAIPTDGTVFGGYAISTSDDIIAVTSHAGFLDSIAQLDANDPIWHTHLVQASENVSCEIVAVDALSLEEPSVMVKVRDTAILVKSIANGTSKYTDALSGEPLEFTVGTHTHVEPDRPNGSTGLVESISFDLNVTEDGTICIGDAVPLVEEELPDKGKDLS